MGLGPTPVTSLNLCKDHISTNSHIRRCWGEDLNVSFWGTQFTHNEGAAPGLRVPQAEPSPWSGPSPDGGELVPGAPGSQLSPHYPASSRSRVTEAPGTESAPGETERPNR